ncbi:MAG: N-6 DNA methylase, partial [Thermodesulfobacteriota bacterium]|nr:N-6 DNA methylase [Thermodesulfobacteriota bacterium]
MGSKDPPLRKDRPTLFDTIDFTDKKNIFCDRADLNNESTVEQRFALRLLSDLGYKDAEIKSKDQISPMMISLGRKKIPYRPDFQVLIGKRVGWVLDAKATTEQLGKWVGQCASYCFEINKDREEKHRTKYFMLTNGITTRVYMWDSNKPILELAFSDFQYGNPLYEELRRLLSKSSFGRGRDIRITKKFDFQKPSMQRVRQLFTDCHAKIWKMDKRSPASAFSEFIKLMFVKLYEDRELRANPVSAEFVEKGLPLPAEAVTFSVRWIEAREKETDNPVDAILFTRLRKAIEDEIRINKKKRVFNPNERIELRPSTVKEVVRRMEHHDLFGIDEDLNGRLFESFLTATMRGRELGQFFTPRSIVKLMTELADLKAGRDHIDAVLDACCGTGGFLIEALTEMRNKIRNNASLTSKEKKDL